jgi:hypothetical protein
MAPYDATWHALLWWTGPRAGSERMACHIIADSGYDSVVPTHPLGGPDHGADATCTKDGKPAVMAAYFPLGPKTFPAVKKKLGADIKAAKDGGREFSHMAFVTGQRLTEGERKQLVKLGVADGVEIELFDLERCTHILDLTHMADHKERYLDIPKGKPPLLVAVDVIGAAGYLDDGDDLLDRLVHAEQIQLEEEAQKLRDNPPDPNNYKFLVAPAIRSLGYDVSDEPTQPKTAEEIEQHLDAFESDLEGHWQESLDYLAGVSWPAVRFRVANGAQSFLNNVQIVVTFDGAEGVEHNYVEGFQFEKVIDPDWRPVDSFGQHTYTDFKRALPSDYPIKWRNVDGNLRVRITLRELRPTPPWESEEDCGEDVVLVLRDTELETVSATYTVTADTYGEVFEGTLKIPVERISAVEAMRSAAEHIPD